MTSAMTAIWQEVVTFILAHLCRVITVFSFHYQLFLSDLRIRRSGSHAGGSMSRSYPFVTFEQKGASYGALLAPADTIVT